VTTTAPPVPDANTGQHEPGPQVTRRQARTLIAIIVVVLLAGTLIALLQPRPPITGYLSPDDPGPTGTKALASILGSRGHPVQPVTTVPAATAAATPGTTLVITNPYLLTAPQLRALARTQAALVIVEPDQDTLTVLAPQLSLAGSQPVTPLLPTCALQAATLAGPADLGGPGLRVQPGTKSGTKGAPRPTQCYVDADGLPTLVQFSDHGRPVTVLSAGTALSNAYLAQQGNAALAINLLSTRGPVIWLVPQVVVPAAGASSGSKPFLSLVPLAAWLVIIQLGLALLLAVAWRARRLGPLVTEPLPVVVRASETVEGHARLYRSRRARDRVAATLRQATVARLAPAVGLPAQADPSAVTAALAARSTLDEPAVRELLYGPPPGSDAALVTLASDLDALEGEVRRQ
jgi:hypothetical protein